MENTKGLIAFIETHPKTTFAFKAALWACFAAILPFLFIALRYDLFTKASTVQISGWGVIAIIIVGVFLITIIKYVKAIMKMKYSFAGQCVDGVCKVVIPLVCLLLIVTVLKNNIDVFIQSLECTILCEIVAIPLNPFPKFIKELKLEEGKSFIDYLSEKLKGGK